MSTSQMLVLTFGENLFWKNTEKERNVVPLARADRWDRFVTYPFDPFPINISPILFT